MGAVVHNELVLAGFPVPTVGFTVVASADITIVVAEASTDTAIGV